jgi:hypothetical protein
LSCLSVYIQIPHSPFLFPHQHRFGHHTIIIHLRFPPFYPSFCHPSLHSHRFHLFTL